MGEHLGTESGGSIWFRGRSFLTVELFLEWLGQRIHEGIVDESMAEELLGNPVSEVRITALEALRPPGDWGLRLLRRAARDPKSFPFGTRGALPAALASFGSEAENELLNLAATAGDPDDRFVSLDALKHVGTKRSVEVLKRMLVLSRNRGVSREIDEAVKGIEDRLRSGLGPEPYPPRPEYGALRFKRRIEQMIRSHGFIRTNAADLELRADGQTWSVIVQTEAVKGERLATLDLRLTLSGPEGQSLKSASLYHMTKGPGTGWAVNEADRDSLVAVLAEITQAFETVGLSYLTNIQTSDQPER